MRYLFGFRPVNDAIMGFRGETRGQSEVVGAILIFGIVVAFIGMNQAFLVPQANADVESKHSNDVQRDIIHLRSGTVEAAGSNEPRSRDVALGTDYPARFIAINPPPATGTINTFDPGATYSADHDDLDLSRVCGTDEDPDTKFIRYHSNYNEYQNSPSSVIENTVSYREAGGNHLITTGQIFAQGRQIHIVRYVGDLQETSSSTTSIDLIPSATGLTRINTSEDSLSMTIPTQLTEDEWKGIVGSQVESISKNDNQAEFVFEDDAVYTVKCTTIGINEEPDVVPAIDREVEDDERANVINPSGEGEIVLNDTQDLGQRGNDTVWIELQDNTGISDLDITAARLNYYLSAEAGNSEEYPDNVSIEGTTPYHEIGGPFWELDTSVELNNGTTTRIELTFRGADRGGNGNNAEKNVQPNDFYVLTLGFSDGSVNTYFIAHPGSNNEG